MIITNFSVNIENFKNAPKSQKVYTLGLMFESSLIEEKIASIQSKFYSNFIRLFMTPFLLIVSAFLLVAVLFIHGFSRRIFTTINNLSDKIDLLNRHHKVKAKNQRRGLS